MDVERGRFFLHLAVAEIVALRRRSLTTLSSFRKLG